MTETPAFIGAFWHENVVMTALLNLSLPRKVKKRMLVMASPSRDGEWISQFLGWAGIETARVSSNKKNVSGTLQVMKRIRKENRLLIIAVDGPRGPRHQIQKGLYLASQIAKAPIIPIRFEAKHFHRFASWDRCILPYPFQTIEITLQQAIPIKSYKDEDEIDRAERQIKQLLGGDHA